MCRCALVLAFLTYSAAGRVKTSGHQGQAAALGTAEAESLTGGQGSTEAMLPPVKVFGRLLAPGQPAAFGPSGSHPVVSGAGVKAGRKSGFPLMAPKQSPSDYSRRKLLSSAAAAGLAAAQLPYTASAATPIYQPPPGSLTSQTILITGANTGLGLESAKRLAKAGAKVVLTARTQAKADQALADVKATVPNADVKSLVLDLANLESVRSFPAKYNSAVGAPLDVLMANAGVMAIPERLSTADGFEKTVGINHLGHFALVSGMMPMLRKAPNGFRVISVSSNAYQFATRQTMNAGIASDLDPKDYTLNGWGAYGLSKAANIIFANELQRRLRDAGVPGSAVSLNPGVVQTELVRYIIQGVEGAEAGVPLKETFEAMSPIQKTLAQGGAKFTQSVEEGANTHVYLAAAADSNGDLTKDGGKYFENMKAVAPADFTNDREIAGRLWDLSEKLTGSKIVL